MTQESLPRPDGAPEGQVLLGKYRVERVLGGGGMGTVVAAHHLQLDTPVAIKFLRPSFLTDQDAVACFMREARAAIQMNNEHVTRVFDVGRLATGAPYMVMELLDGADLGTLLQEQGVLPIETAVDFVLQACEAVAEAHALGIVHRDLKPANLFRITRPDGRAVIKVLDFGISKVTKLPARQSVEMSVEASAQISEPARAAEPAEPVAPASLAGTPRYMSPEQIEGSHAVDARSDIWALGVVLYELVSGKLPFGGDDLSEVSASVLASEPAPLRGLVPDGLAIVIETCLAKQRELRYPNVAALAMALLPFGPLQRTSSVHRIMDFLQVDPLPALASEPAPSLALVPAFTPAWSSSSPASRDASATAPSPTEASHANPGAGPRSRKAIIGVMAAAAAVAVTVALALTTVSARTAARIREATATRSARTAAAPAPGPAPRQDPTLPSLASGVATTAAAAPQPATEPPVEPAPAAPASPRGPGAEDSPRPTVARAGSALNDPRLNPRSARASRNALALLRPPPTASAAASAAGAHPQPSARATPATCNPAFELDGLGRKHFKAECLSLAPAAAKTNPQAVAASSDCEPDFELDDQGRKHFKPACFLNTKP